MVEIHEPQLTFYSTWDRVYRLRVDLNIPKLYYGSNINLPNPKDLRDILPLVSNNVKERTGFNFDAFGAEIHRIHYAFNHQSENNNVKSVIDCYKDYKIPRMKTTVINNETVYLQNKSRGIRIYDKQAEVIKEKPLPEFIELAEGITRFEYFIDGGKYVKRFAKRLGFKNHTAQEMMSARSINAATSEMRLLLGFDNLKLAGQSELDILFQKTGDLNTAWDLFSFLESLKNYGNDFYRNSKYKVSKATYYRRLRECRNFGLCPLG